MKATDKQYAIWREYFWNRIEIMVNESIKTNEIRGKNNHERKR
jgi:hypothetical protein